MDEALPDELSSDGQFLGFEQPFVVTVHVFFLSLSTNARRGRTDAGLTWKSFD
jgi:hypothetical protein